jgi:hypothetical protein
MLRSVACVLSLVAFAGLAACTQELPSSEPGQALAATSVEPMDTDGDGKPDALDVDGDGVPDLDIGDGIELCPKPLIDEDGDGLPEGIDLDCDGTSDIDLGVAELPELPDLPEVPPGTPPAPGTPPLPDDLCLPSPLDADGDGRCDGLDLDCDGVADITL